MDIQGADENESPSKQYLSQKLQKESANGNVTPEGSVRGKEGSADELSLGQRFCDSRT